MAEKEAAFCPNCSKPAVRQGKVIICEHCDASFRFTQEGPKLHEIGPLESRLQWCEEKLGKVSPEPPEPPEPPEIGRKKQEHDDPEEIQGEDDEDENGI